MTRLEIRRTYIYRTYFNCNGTQCPYQDMIHDTDDNKLFQLGEFSELFNRIEVEDGDEIEISIVKTGVKLHANKEWRLTSPHKYEPLPKYPKPREEKEETK